MKKSQVPEGYMRNSKGGFDPVEMVKDIDKARNDLVMDIIEKSIEASQYLRKLKKSFFDDVRAFTELSAERYGVHFGGRKGNMTFTSYDGEYRITVAVNEAIAFDEGLLVAKELIDQCIQQWSEGSPAELRVLVDDAFYVGKSGKINSNRILGLRRLAINDERWKKAMDAISDSVRVAESKEYIRVYRRTDSGEYELINLDVASL